MSATPADSPADAADPPAPDGPPAPGPAADGPPATAPAPDGHAPVQPSIRRMRDHAVRPRRDLGQNFLVDDNLLDVISNLAQLREDDVALEVGGGLGVLSEHLATRVAHLHVVELDRTLEAPLREALDPHANATLHLADAMRMDLTALDPEPTVCVSNLPYSVAAGVILRSVVDLPRVDRWVGMVQREVGERFAARAGTDAYGVPSVLAQLSCEVRVLRQVSRRVFSPVPNVDSVLLGLTRVRPPAPKAVRELASASFAHRRKALARSASLDLGRARERGRRDALRTALDAAGLPLDVRAERLAADEFVALARALAVVEDDAATVAEIDAWGAAA